MADAAKQNPGTLLRRGVGLVPFALIVGCTAPQPHVAYHLANGGQPLSNPQGVCVQIGPSAPDAKPGCYQLSQAPSDEHVEPLPLDEFGYLFPPLKPLPQLAPVNIPSPATLATATPAPPVPFAASATPVAPAMAPLASATAPIAAVVPTYPIARYTTKAIHFSTSMPFKLNSAHLSRANRDALVAFVDSLAQYRGIVSMRVTGHTDRSGPVRFNLWLSRMRAKSVQSRLLSLGADSRSLEIRGVGSSQPRPHSQHAADNRYVDIEVVVRVAAD